MVTLKHALLPLIGLIFLTQTASADTPRATFSATELKWMLAGRVLIEMQTEEQTYTTLPKGRVFGFFWRDDGTATVCMAGLHKGRAIGPLALDWQLRDADVLGATWSMNVQGRKPSKKRFVPVYDRKTGIFDLHLKHEGRWIVAKRSWVQEATWPRVLRESCPDMYLPSDMSINEKQTAQAFSEMRGQDLSAIVPLHRTGRCAGDHEGIATWTLGADGKKVWDTSGCEKRTE